MRDLQSRSKLRNPPARFFHEHLRRMQVVAGGNYRKQQQENTCQRQQCAEIRQAFQPRLRVAPQEDQERAHAQGEPDQIKQQLHSDVLLV